MRGQRYDVLLQPVRTRDYCWSSTSPGQGTLEWQLGSWLWPHQVPLPKTAGKCWLYLALAFFPRSPPELCEERGPVLNQGSDDGRSGAPD